MTRLSSAMTSSDLSHLDRDCDVDVVGAAGGAAQHLPLGVLLAEVRQCACGDSGASVGRLRELQAAVTGKVPGWARHWRVTVRARPVAMLLTREYVDSSCHRCQGRGFLPLSYGQDVVETGPAEIDCPSCLGSGQGKRDLRARAAAAGHPSYTRPLGEFWEDALSRLARAESSALSVISYRLGGR